MSDSINDSVRVGGGVQILLDCRVQEQEQKNYRERAQTRPCISAMCKSYVTCSQATRETYQFSVSANSLEEGFLAVTAHGDMEKQEEREFSNLHKLSMNTAGRHEMYNNITVQH